MTNDHQLGDEPIEERFIKDMNAVARALDDVFNGATYPVKQVGFVLLVFPYGEVGRCNYISNGANREDMVTLLREQADRFEETINEQNRKV